MTIPAVVLTASQAAVKALFAPTSVGRFLNVVALPGAAHVQSGIYFVSAHRGVRGCNGNSWLTLCDNELGTVELSWREAVVTEIASVEVVTKVAEMAVFFGASAPVVTASVVVEIPVEDATGILAPVSTELEAPALDLSVLISD